MPERAALLRRLGLPLALGLVWAASPAWAQPATPVPVPGQSQQAQPATPPPVPGQSRQAQPATPSLVPGQGRQAQPASPSPDAPAPEVGTRPLAEALRVVGGRCWTSESLVAAVRAWLKRDEVDERLAIEVRHLRGPPERVIFVVRRPGARASERAFSDLRLPCDDQRAAVALSIALSIDATLLSRPEPPPVEPPAEAAPAPPAPAPAPVPKPPAVEPAARRAPASRARPPLPVRASVEAGAAFGALPAPAPFAFLGLGVGPFHGA
ncbi:MAG TPA: hypothetical protein VFS00_13825, partial [Polyangiaceae bacterium]|nr:hypothetical protein [Polyangiaceae bacterium]